MAVTMNLARGFDEVGEQLGGQGFQCRGFHVAKVFAHLSPGGAVDAGVGGVLFPLLEVAVLLGQTAELAALERVVLAILDAGLDLALVPGHARLGGQDERPVVGGELGQLGVEIRFIPIGLEHAGLEVVDHHLERHAAQGAKAVLQATDEGLGVLLPDHLAVALARMTQDRPEQMGPATLAVLIDHPRALTEIDLQLLPRSAFHAPKRRFALSQVEDEASDRMVTAFEVRLGPQILEDALDGKSRLPVPGDALGERFALALGPARTGLRYGWF